MLLMVRGMIAMGSFAVALFFVRFWKETADRFYLFFAGAFFLMGVGRIGVGLTHIHGEYLPFWLLFRLLAYLLIIAAIVDKNLSGSRQ